jgi:hypothetical protein
MSAMKRLRGSGGSVWLVVGLLALSCKKDDPPETEDDTGDSGGINVTDGADGPKLDVMPGADSDTGEPPTGCGSAEGAACSNRLDLLFVIDNSGSMSEEQLNLARNMPGLVRALENLTDAEGNPVSPDVNIMVTTTDSGNVLCEPFYKPGRGPEMGAPIDTACTERLDRFSSVDMPPVVAEDACTNVCPNPVAPDGSYINFTSAGSNVPATDPVDVDGDGEPDSAVAQALACIGPQGIDGCGYESPLDSMMRALDPEAEWNGDGGFLRPGGLLAVAIITDEADCSIVDESVMTDEAVQGEHPDLMMPVASSAICWNAGVSCDGPDGNGEYSNCVSSGDSLRPVQEYIDLLGAQDRPVVMLGILGVPPVTERNPDPPYEPLAGGVLDLVYRDWRDPDYANGGDILPDDWDAGRDAAYKQWQFGVGPGCTGEDESGDFTGQAIPPVRVKEVCQALDTDDEIRCCIESICDTDFSPALRCLAGLIQENFTPVG